MSLSDSVYFAVIDTETNFNDRVISVGVVIADSYSFEPVDRLYLVLTPEYKQPSMFGNVLEHNRAPIDAIVRRKEAVRQIKSLLTSYDVTALFAYNAAFDKGHLPELSDYDWYDIMRIAIYRQYNNAIPLCCECYKTGRMKSGYGAEDIYKMLSCDCRYREVHNALADAEDELEIMRLLSQNIDVYEISNIK